MPGKRGAPSCCAEYEPAVAARVASRRSSGRDRDSVCEEPAAKVSRADRKPLGDAAAAPRGPVTLPEAGFPSSRGHLAAASAGPADWRALATRSQAWRTASAHSPAAEVVGPRIRASGPIRPNETIRSRPIRDSESIPSTVKSQKFLTF